MPSSKTGGPAIWAMILLESILILGPDILGFGASSRYMSPPSLSPCLFRGGTDKSSTLSTEMLEIDDNVPSFEPLFTSVYLRATGS